MTETIYDRLVRGVLYAGAFLVPLFFLPWGSAVLELNKQLLLVVLASAGLVLWLLGVVLSGKATVRSSLLDKALVVFAVAVGAASLFSVARGASVLGSVTGASGSFLSVAALTVLALLAVNAFHDRGRRLLQVFTAAVVIALLFGMLQMFAVYVLGAGFAHSRVFNTVGSVNSLGILAAVSLPLFLKVRLRLAGSSYLDVAKLGFAPALAILVILNWWVLWLVAIAGMVGVMVFESFLMPGSRFKISRFLVPMSIIVLGVFLLLIRSNVGFVKNNLPVEIAPGFQLSGRVIRGVLQENPIFGYGPENFALAFDKYGARELARTTVSGVRFFDGTGEAVSIVVGGGAVLAAAFLFVLISFVVTALRIQRSFGADDAGDADDAVGVLATASALTVALFLYPLNLVLSFSWFLLLALVALALIGGRQTTVDIEEHPAWSLGASLGFIAGLIAVLAGLYFTAARYGADVAYARALSRTDAAARLELLGTATRWNAQDSRFYRAGSQATMDQLAVEVRKRADAQQQAKVRDLITSAIDLAKQGTVVGPRDVENWLNLGRVYQNLIGFVDGAEMLAEQAYLSAADLRVGDPSFFNAIGSAYFAKAELNRQLASSAGANAAALNIQTNASLAKAEENFRKAIALSDTYGLAIYNLAAVYDRAGKLTDAITQLERIAPANADQPNILFELGLLYYRAGRKNDAFNVLQRAVVLSPDFANARWYLALIYEERRDLPAAIQELEKILETNVDNEAVVAKLDQLRKGRTNIPPQRVIDQKPL